MKISGGKSADKDLRQFFFGMKISIYKKLWIQRYETMFCRHENLLNLLPTSGLIMLLSFLRMELEQIFQLKVGCPFKVLSAIKPLTLSATVIY